MIKNTDSLFKYRLLWQMLEVEYEELERNIEKSLAILRNNETEQEQKYLDIKCNIKINNTDESDSFLFFGFTQYLLKHSLFISAYSFMEYALSKICETIASQLNKHERRVSNFEKVYQYYSFLMNEVQLDKGKVEADWIKLNIFRDLRNSIIHCHSNISKNISTKTYEFIREDARIEFNEPRGFRIKDDSLILDLITTSKRFLFTLMNEYDQKYLQEKFR